MKKLIFLIFMLSGIALQAQENYLKLYGMGFLTPVKGAEKLNINFPNAKIALYEHPQGNKCGYIYKKDLLNVVYQVNGGKQAYGIALQDMTEFEKKNYCLKFFEQRNGFVKVILNSNGRGYWISEKELGYLNYTALTWLSYLNQRKTGLHPLHQAGVNMRAAPDAKSKKIELLKGDRYLIDLTGNTEGMWAECNCRKYDVRPCKYKSPGTLKPIAQYKGWIKLTDDGGYPNLWFYIDGCR